MDLRPRKGDFKLRKSGVLMHISSLPSGYGIGSFGKEAYEFVDFLKNSGQSLWQILPLCPGGKGNSPYMSFSNFAGNSLFIDLDFLCQKGLLTESEIHSCDFGEEESRVDFEKVIASREKLLPLAAERFFLSVPYDYEDFCKENEFWLRDFALFMALKEKYGDIPWNKWEKPLKLREEKALAKVEAELLDKVNRYKMEQYLFYSQWYALKSYANKKGIEIVGDIPIYVAYDSADVWASPENFLLDEEYSPRVVAGCPPDAFSEDGQLWGNPVYDWNKMKEDGYIWWAQRLSNALKVYDRVRIDHFRGFESYYCIGSQEKTAKNGKWEKGPGSEFFALMKKKLGSLPVIAEDLGMLTDDVRKMLKKTGLPGMKILEFAFDADDSSAYLPHNHIKNCVVYTGTHDNDTVLGWIDSLSQKDRAFVKRYLRLSVREGYNWGIIKSAMMSVADTVIIPMQDFLGLGSEGRMNVPGVATGNWSWRMKNGAADEKLSKKIKKITETYRRLPPEKKKRKSEKK